MKKSKKSKKAAERIHPTEFEFRESELLLQVEAWEAELTDILSRAPRLPRTYRKRTDAELAQSALSLAVDDRGSATRIRALAEMTKARLLSIRKRIERQIEIPAGLPKWKVDRAVEQSNEAAPIAGVINLLSAIVNMAYAAEGKCDNLVRSVEEMTRVQYAMLKAQGE